MEISRYVIVQAILTKENKLIPIWDERIQFNKMEDYGTYITIKDNYFNQYFYLTECVYDLKTKELKGNIELDYFPDENDLEFKVGQTIYYDVSYRELKESIISKIIYEEYELEIKKGSNFDRWDIEKFKDIEINPNLLYTLKIWKPFFGLEDGTIIKWKHKLYNKYNEQ